MNDDARGTLVTAVLDSAYHRHMEDEAGQFDWFYCIDPDETANAVIAYLWEQADRPEVVEVVDKALTEWATHPDRLVDGYDHEMRTSVAITALLTALIGPRPTEQETSDV